MNKIDNLSDLIREQGDKQLNTIGKINLDKTRAIDFYDGADKGLKDLVNKVKKETDENENEDNFFVCIISGKTFDFSRYTNSSNFGSKTFTNKLSLNKAKNERKNIRLD